MQKHCISAFRMVVLSTSLRVPESVQLGDGVRLLLAVRQSLGRREGGSVGDEQWCSCFEGKIKMFGVKTGSVYCSPPLRFTKARLSLFPCTEILTSCFSTLGLAM